MEDQKKFFKGIIPPPILFFAFILIGFAAQWLSPISLIFYEWPARLIVGLPIFVTSGLIAINTLRIMKKHKTAINFNNPTTKFITEGTFRFTRNPLYLALLLVMISISVFANSAWHIIAFLLPEDIANTGAFLALTKMLHTVYLFGHFPTHYSLTKLAY